MISAALFAGTGWEMPKNPYQWYQDVLVAAILCLFWYKGTTLATRQMSYRTVCNHFDLGISLLFALLLIKFMIRVKGGTLFPDAFTRYTMAGYFFFGLAAVFFSHTPKPFEKQYLKGFHVYGALISGFFILLFCAMAAIFVLLPFLTGFAESGYSVLKQVAGPLSPYLIAILRFIFSVRRPLAKTGVTQNEQGFSGPDITSSQGVLAGADYFAYAILVVFILMGIVMLVYLARIVYQFLMSKHAPALAGKKKANILFRLMAYLVSVYTAVKNRWIALTEEIVDARKGFLKLVSWGKKSGMPLLQSETPAEYGKRLGQRFLPLEHDIKTIVHAFHLEFYGEVPLDQARVLEMVKALRTIHSPSFWFIRIKSVWKRL